MAADKFLDKLGPSTPVSEGFTQRHGYVKAAIACRIAFYCNLEAGECRATVATLAKKIGMANGTVSTNLKWLRDNGFIRVMGEYRSGNIPNRYTVTDKFFEHCQSLEHSGDECYHSADESQAIEHSGDESNIQQMNENIQEMNGEEEVKEDLKEIPTTTTAPDPKIINDETETAAALKALTTNYTDFISVSIQPIIADEFKHYAPRVKAAWVANAFNAAIKANVRNWNYPRAILENCIDAGQWVDRKNGGANNGHHSSSSGTTRRPPKAKERTNITPEEFKAQLKAL